MAIYKIFPSKDASLYTISQSMNTGLDEILEASTAIESSQPQVSRYLLEFSQTEINNFVEKQYNLLDLHLHLLLNLMLLVKHYILNLILRH